MSHATTYIQSQQTSLFKELGAFYAFSNKEFNEVKEEGVQYVKGPAGLLMPKDNAKELCERLLAIHKQGRSKDLKENGMAGIMQREFANHECNYTGNYETVKDALSDYNFSDADYKEQFSIFWQQCIDDNNF